MGKMGARAKMRAKPQTNRMPNLVQLMFNPFGSAGGVYGQEIAFLGQKGPILTLLGPPGDTFWGP